MNYKEYFEYIHSKNTFLGDYTIVNVKKLAEKLGNPQDKIKTIHVSGTNGKGSICRYIEKAMEISDYKCGLFTSPYIDNFREQISINEKYISEDEFVSIMDEIYPKILELDEEGYIVTTFEILTVLAYLYFHEMKVDVAVIEVGMGGRFDSTNIIKSPLASVITSISLDHTSILGDSLAKIAWHKGGIIKENSVLFSYPQSSEAKEVLINISKEKNVPYEFLDFSNIENIISTDRGNSFTFLGKDYKTSLIGNHQVYNASLSIMLLNYLKSSFKNLTDDNIKKSIYESKNIGRLERFNLGFEILLDGSHNKESISALIESLKNFKYKNLILGFSMLGDKDIDFVAKNLFPLASKIVLTTIDNDRASSIEFLESEVNKYTNIKCFPIEDRKLAFEKSLSLCEDGDLLLWCGSLYLIKDIRKYVLEYMEKKEQGEL